MYCATTLGWQQIRLRASPSEIVKCYVNKFIRNTTLFGDEQLFVRNVVIFITPESEFLSCSIAMMEILRKNMFSTATSL